MPNASVRFPDAFGDGSGVFRFILMHITRVSVERIRSVPAYSEWRNDVNPHSPGLRGCSSRRSIGSVLV